MLALVVGIAPASVGAQVGRFGRGGIPRGPAREPGIEIPSQVNMINLLIERRQEVALTDSQFMRVIALKRELDSTNAPHMRTLDSISRLFRKGQFVFSQPSRERNDSLAQARMAVREASAAVGENNASARDRAYVLLTDTQVAKARAIQSKAEQALAATAAARKP